MEIRITQKEHMNDADNDNVKRGDRPLVSIIVPAYNTEKYIAKCVSSLSDQDYENIEILVTDDGSTDRTPEILTTMAQQDFRIKVTHTDNQGPAHARNVALDIAKGDYVTFVDSDDYLCKCAIREMVSKAQQSGCDILVCGITQEWKDGTRKTILPYTDLQSKMMEDGETFRARNGGEVYVNDVFSYTACNKLFRRKLIGDTRFPSFQVGEDVLFNRLVFPQNGLIHMISDSYYINVQRENSATRSKHMKKEIMDVYLSVIDEMKTTPFDGADKKTLRYWNMSPGKLLFELTVSLLLEGNAKKVKYVVSHNGYFKELRHLRLGSGQADAKKTLMILLLRLGLYHAAVSVSHMHRENIKRKRVVS